MPESNPFFHRGPVRDQAYFFGRQQETKHLFELLLRGQSVSISGQRRLGKTSLLFHAVAAEVSARHGLDPLRTRWVHLDGGMFDGLGEEWLYGAIVRELGNQADTADYPQLVGQLRALAGQGLCLIVAFDEFELFAKNTQFQPHTFNRLRGLTDQLPVQFVIASKVPLGRLSFANPAVMSSHFFNIFAPYRLSLFKEEDAVEMLMELSRRGAAPFRPDTIAYIFDLVGPHPLFLQVAGYHAFEEQVAGKLSSGARSVVRERVIADLEAHLEYYWRDLTPEEEYALATLPMTANDSQSSGTVNLADSALIYRKGYLGSSVREFVARQAIDGLLRYGPFVMDVRQRSLTVDEQPVHLTPTEFSALRLLLQSPERLFTPEDIEAAIWPGEIAPDPQRAPGLMKKLRKALGGAGEAIVTHRGQGYRLSLTE